jgi:hypothetical protein
MTGDKSYCEVCDTMVYTTHEGELICGHTGYDHDYDDECYNELNFDEQIMGVFDSGV